MRCEAPSAKRGREAALLENFGCFATLRMQPVTPFVVSTEAKVRPPHTLNFHPLRGTASRHRLAVALRARRFAPQASTSHSASQLHCKILHCKIENKDEGIEKITQRSVLFFSMRSTKQVSGLFSPFLHLDPQFCDTSFFWTVACDCGRCVFRSFRCSISLLAKACHHHHSHHGNTSSMPHNHTTTATCTVTAATSSASES